MRQVSRKLQTDKNSYDLDRGIKIVGELKTYLPEVNPLQTPQTKISHLGRVNMHVQCNLILHFNGSYRKLLSKIVGPLTN